MNSDRFPQDPVKGVVLSMVTVTRDDLSGLARTLQSTSGWLADSRAEQIVIDASDPPAVVEESGVRLLRQQSREIAAAFNEGLTAAQGEWIWFLNGGDAVHENLDPNWMFSFLRRTRADVVTGAVHYDGEKWPRTAPPLWRQWPPLVCWLAHPATLVRREVLMRAGGFDPRWRIGMDFDLWFRLLSKNTLVDVISLPLARFDVSGVSQRLENRPRRAAENARILWRHRGVIAKSLSRNLIGLLSVIRHTVADRWF